MPRRDTNPPPPTKRRPAPAKTPEGREAQLIEAAMDLAERQIREGTASSQVITHFVKLGSIRNEREMRKIELEGDLLQAKREALEAQQHAGELYEKAIEAFKYYKGEEVELTDD